MAQAQGYAYNAIQKAFAELERDVSVGTWFITKDERVAQLPSGSYYKVYPMDKETREKREGELRWFDEL